MADSLPQLLARLNREVGAQERRRLAGAIAGRLRTKLRRVAGVLAGARPWVNAIPSAADALLALVEEDAVSAALKTEAAMRFAIAALNGGLATDVLFEGGRGGPVSCLRLGASMSFSENGKIVVRSVFRSHSKTGGTTKHLSTSRVADASKYAKGLAPFLLETRVVEMGRGHVFNGDGLMMYALFNADVGTAFHRNARTASRILKVQCDRTPRGTRRCVRSDGTIANRAQGYWMRMHGYPITERELHADFASGADLVLANPLAMPR